MRGLTSNLINISQLCEQGMNVNFKNSECLVTKENGEVLIRGIKTKEKCYEWISQLERKKAQQTKKLQIMLEHHQFSKMFNLSHYDNIYAWRNVSSMGSLLINKQISQQYSFNLVGMNIVSTKDLLVVTSRRMLDIKLFEKPMDKSGISQRKELQQLLYNKRATSFCVSLHSLVHVNLGDFLNTFTQHNHLSLTPIHASFFFKLPKTVLIHTFATRNHQLPSITDPYHQLHITMKFKTDVCGSKEKNPADQTSTNTPTPKMVEPITTVSPPKSKMKTLTKSSLNKKKAPKTKKGESKTPLSMVDLYEKENPCVSTVVEPSCGTYMKDLKNADAEANPKTASDAATSVAKKKVCLMKP